MRKASGSRPRDAAAELIECYIRSQNLSPHDRLPSERAMCEMWGLNRSTLRTAIRRLTEEGWLYSVLGSGTFVAPPKLERDLQDARSLTETVRDAGRMIRSQVLDLRITECSAWLSGKLGCAPGHPVFFLRRLRFLDNVPFTSETCYLDHEVCPGIENGDYIFIDPKFTVTGSGFLKSRFIDDKASAVVLLMLLRWCGEHSVPFLHPTKIYFSVFEEVGHGASAVGEDVDEFVTVDMGCVGLDLAGSEYAVSICAKDSGGPYDYELTGRLIELAKASGVAHTVDIFPFYGSDVGAALRSGRDLKGALIGTGVCASHGMERTHLEGIEATLKLLYLYLCGAD